MSICLDSGELFATIFTLRIPLYRARYSAQYRQSVEQSKSLGYIRSETKNQLRTELEQALEQYRESARSLTLLNHELIPRAELALRSEEHTSELQSRGHLV